MLTPGMLGAPPASLLPSFVSPAVGAAAAKQERLRTRLASLRAVAIPELSRTALSFPAWPAAVPAETSVVASSPRTLPPCGVPKLAAPTTVNPCAVDGCPRLPPCSVCRLLPLHTCVAVGNLTSTTPLPSPPLLPSHPPSLTSFFHPSSRDPRLCVLPLVLAAASSRAVRSSALLYCVEAPLLLPSSPQSSLSVSFKACLCASACALCDHCNHHGCV